MTSNAYPPQQQSGGSPPQIGGHYGQPGGDYQPPPQQAGYQAPRQNDYQHQQLAATSPVSAQSAAVGRPEGSFYFDGGAGSFFFVSLGSTLLTVLTLGLALPWATAMYYRWQTNHTIINGRRLRFTGTGGGLFGHYIKWWLLTVITLGIYSFWVWPRMTKWAVERQDFGPMVR